MAILLTIILCLFMSTCMFLCLCVSASTCLYHKVCLSQGQRLTSGIGLYFLPCLRESLLMSTAAYATLVVQNLVIPLISASQLQAVHQDYDCIAVLLDFDVISKEPNSGLHVWILRTLTSNPVPCPSVSVFK